MGYEYVEEPVVGAKIKVIGVGGGGGNALNCIAQASIFYGCLLEKCFTLGKKIL